MTISRAEKLARRQALDPETTLAGYAARAFELIAATAHKLQWPNGKYATDPEGFARDILGVTLWSKQVEIANAVVEYRKTSVRSGHRIGKSEVCAILALWFYCSFPKARVFLTAPTMMGVEDVIWRAIRILIQERAGTCVNCRLIAERANPDRPEYPKPCPHSALIDGDLHASAGAGIVSLDHREISGHTADRPEALAGRASPHLLYICDEASGINDAVFQVIQGNLAAAGARFIMIGNPTQTTGTFHESHTTKKANYHTIHISSYEAAKQGIEGLASDIWIQETAELYGIDSGEFMIRVKGEFAPTHTQKVISLTLIDEAMERWERTLADGPLSIGVDVARFGDDDTAVAVCRGFKILEIVSKNGLDEHGATQLALAVADKYRAPREFCTINVDSAGVGIPVVIALNKMKSHYHRIVPLHAGQDATDKRQYHSLRDQLWFAMAEWLRSGGALPPNQKLSEELHAPKYTYDNLTRKWVESKDIIRKAIKRSPDLADACLIAGTLVETSEGARRIETIRVGDYVMTRKGWRRVLASAMTSPSAPVLRVDLEDGRSLVGTGNHPVWTDEFGFIRLDALAIGVCASVWEREFEERSSCFAGSSLSATPIPHRLRLGTISTRSTTEARGFEESAHSTANSGRRTTGRSLTACRSTTSTETSSTTTSRTWSASRRKNTSLGTPAPNERARVENTFSRCLTWLRSGTARLRGWLGTPSTANDHGTTARDSQSNASCAALSTRTCPATTTPNTALTRARNAPTESRAASPSSVSSAGGRSIPPSTAPPRLASARVVRISESGTAAVFNLTVEGEPEYFANGILVHNCNLAIFGMWGTSSATGITPIPHTSTAPVPEVSPVYGPRRSDEGRGTDGWSPGRSDTTYGPRRR